MVGGRAWNLPKDAVVQAARRAFAEMQPDYCDSCGSHWTDIQNGCRWHPLKVAVAALDAAAAHQSGVGAPGE